MTKENSIMCNDFKTYEEYKEPLIKLGRRHGLNLDLDNPKTIQDKINWLKIYDSTPLKTKCADKIQLHDYCKEKLGKDICVPIIAIYDKVDDIEWNKLPERFVIKCNHGSGMNIIVKDKNTLNIDDAKRKLVQWMNTDFAFRVGYEMHYHDIPRKIFVEEYKEDEKQTKSLFDYKFWCFNGEPKCYTINDGVGHGDIIYYDMNDNLIDPYNLAKPDMRYKKPFLFDEMVKHSRKLSEDFKFVRVDFYEVNDRLYLGELTFTPGAGFFNYKKREYNDIFGDFLNLGNNKIEKKKIIVSMTSWTKRIDNVSRVLESLLHQDLEPDLIQINLSKDEFKNKENDLPKDLIKIIENNKRVHIEWVSKNDGVFKKIVPTLKRHYGEDYYLLSVDDDWIYRHDYIKIMVDYIEKYNSDAFCLYKPSCVIGNRMIYKSNIFSNDFWEKLSDDVISTRIDDAYIWHYLKEKNKVVSGFRPDDTPDITKKFNPVYPNSNNSETGNYSVQEITRANNIISKIKF